MREIDPTVEEDKIASTICDGLPLVERDWIWRYRPQTLSELDKTFGYWLEHKEKMKHKTENEANQEIARLEEKVKALEAKEKNISEIVNAVVTSLGVGGVNPQINAISSNTEQQTQNSTQQNSENTASQQNTNATQTQNIGINAMQMPVGVIPPQPQQNYQQNQYYSNPNRGNYRGRGNNNNYRGNNNNRGNGRGNFNNNNNNNYNYNGQNNRNYNNNNNYRGNYNQNNGYRQYRPRNNNNTYGNSFRPRYPNYGQN